ncbi:hypothetical protein Pan189_39300 [Stratiformator vulcanicus]|uniref:DUF1552 domain-containing protein n=2 Tax=Stratiformator vulcanicus TaxID=2527980 RepID=A0A517R6Q5_9PLAN|nr:hypothetical protein Pan189_39300 [Stratiformator vulcanicus]
MRNSISRRTVLRAAGSAIALPWLESLAASANSSSGMNQPPVRLGFVFFPNGAVPDQWRPQGTGTDFKFSPTLSPLSEFREDVLVVSGLAQLLGDVDGGGDHARNAATFLTGARANKSESDLHVGQSIDQFAADRIGYETRLKSLELGIDAGRNAGSCDSGYSCAYSNTISWRSPTQPMPKEVKPRAVFERLFGSKGKGSVAAQARRIATRKSVLDTVAAGSARLRTRIAKSDQRKLDEYLGSLREVERRVEGTDRKAIEPPRDFRVPDEKPDNFEEHARLMYDLMVLAYQTDSTRIASLMLAGAASNRTFPQIEVTDGHHSLSHHQGRSDKIEKLTKIDRYLCEQFAYFIRRLKDTPDGEGNLLDNTIVLYGSGLSDGNEHRHDELPIVLAGGGGRLRGGRHLRYSRGTPLNNLFLNLLDTAGAKDVKRFGDSDGRLPDVVA